MAHIETFIQSAWQHLRADRPKQAMDCAKKAHAISPNSPDVAHLLGLLASRDGKPEIALPLLQKAIDTGGKTPHRLRHIAEALLDAGHPEAALTPLNDAITEFGASSDLLGLKSAIEIALAEWQAAENTAQSAIDLNPSLMAWELNLSFAQLMQGKHENGFKNATARPKNLALGSTCPALMYSEPSEVWLKSEQGLGDTLFYLRYVAPLTQKGWKFHLEADRKLIPLLLSTELFLSVKEKNPCPKNQLNIHLGDLALMASQCGIKDVPPPLALTTDSKLVDKYKQELAKIGPAPYIAITWRAGPKGNKQRAGVATLEKFIDPKLLGGLLANTQATIINLQRLPIIEELQQLHQALGRKSADYSALNNNLAGMLALLSLVDDYITVSNTNLHLREGLAKPSQVFVNRPFQDWRWQAEGAESVWYPCSRVYRQGKDKAWGQAFTELSKYLSQANLSPDTKLKQAKTNQDESTDLTHKSNKLNDSNAVKHTQLIREGWELVANNIPEAIGKARSVLLENPQHPRALHLLGWAAVQDLKFDLAISVLAQAVQLEPNNGNIWRDYIRAHVLLDKCHEAINIAQQCLTNPNLWATGVVHFALGVAYGRLGDDLEALSNYELCISMIPNHIDSMDAAGMLRLRLGENYARLGFKYCTARTEARSANFQPYWVCPVLKQDVAGLNVLIVRSMGFGDELSYLRYLPYLVQAGVKVTYWCGVKLVPLLSRLPYSINIIPDTEPMPDPANYDLSFIKNELPIAVEHLGAPEIADPLALTVDSQKLEYWRQWLKAQGDGPYIGITWRAGVGGKVKDKVSFTRLSKKVEHADFVNALTGINATFISLQRNITKDELNAFETLLDSPIIDLAGLTDDLDDLLCIQYLLDENIGVSNTNMHIRASLGLGSRVLVSYPSTDWRWGSTGNQSVWFKQSKVYRQGLEGDWQTPFNELRKDLVEKYGLAQKQTKKTSSKKLELASKTKKIIWVTAGEIKNGPDGQYSPLASAQERVVNVAQLLATKGWQSSYLNENISELMGGWHDKLPVKGDVVVFSKVFTDHAITLMQDAKARGARIVLDVFNDFAANTKRAIHQRHMMQLADAVVSCPKLQPKWQTISQQIAFYSADFNDELAQELKEKTISHWVAMLNLMTSDKFKPAEKNINLSLAQDAIQNTKKPASQQSKRLVWLTAGDVKNVNGKQSSDLASTRYRVISPSQTLSSYGWQSEIVNETTSEVMSGWGKNAPFAGDTVIISKVFTEHAILMAKDAKSRCARVVVDICDNFLAHPKYGVLQKELLACADKIVTSTQSLNEALAQVGKKADAVISDPVELKRGEIKFSPSKVLKLLWFGHPVNIDTLAQSMPELARLAQTIPLQMQVVTTLPNGQQDLDTITPTGLKASYTPWSVSATEQAIADCDIVIIPTVQNDFKNAKSPNRLLEPLWAGRMVVAGRLPAYLHFADSAWVGKDLNEGIQWCLANPEEVKARIAQGQADVEKYFTQQAIGQQWDALLKSVYQKTNSKSELKTSAKSVQNTEAPQLVKQIALLTMQHPSLPSIAIRLIEPLAILDNYSIKIASGINSKRQLSIDYEALLMRDLIVVQRDFPSADTLPLLKKLKSLGKKLVYETDDAFHLIPAHHSKAFHRAKAPAIFEFAKMADVITVSTQALADEFKSYGSVQVLPNKLSPNLWNEALLHLGKQNRAKHSVNHLRIGIVGGANHRDDFFIIKEAIQIVAKNNSGVNWVAYGESAVSLFDSIPECIGFENHATNYDYPSHPKRMANLELDLALVPIAEDDFNKCISNLKFLEFGFLGVATVFSNVESYNKTVMDGETGMLVNNNTESWVKAIQALIDNHALREKISVNAQKEVQTNWVLNSQNSGWQELWGKLV